MRLRKHIQQPITRKYHPILPLKSECSIFIGGTSHCNVNLLTKVHNKKAATCLRLELN